MYDRQSLDELGQSATDADRELFNLVQRDRLARQFGDDPDSVEREDVHRHVETNWIAWLDESISLRQSIDEEAERRKLPVCRWCGHPVPADGVTITADVDVDTTGAGRTRCQVAACECSIREER
jgi:hypothetical protein